MSTTSKSATLNIFSDFIGTLNKPQGLYCDVPLSYTMHKTTEFYSLSGAWLAPVVEFQVSGQYTAQDLATFDVWNGEGSVNLVWQSQLDKYATPLPSNMINSQEVYIRGNALDNFELSGYGHVEFGKPRQSWTRSYNPVVTPGTIGMLIPGGIGTLRHYKYTSFVTCLPLELPRLAGWEFDTMARCWLFVPMLAYWKTRSVIS